MRAEKRKPKTVLGKIWHFLWVEDSVASWIASVIVAFVVIKSLFYPGLGLLFGTSTPVVAVVSGSMEHSPAKTLTCLQLEGSTCLKHTTTYTLCGQTFSEREHYSFDAWWSVCGPWYESNRFNAITREEFREFPFRNGFNKGDIMVLFGRSPSKISEGDILVYDGGQAYPIIHRVIDVRQTSGKYFFTTKGDHNKDVIQRQSYEENISEDQVIGVAVFKIPLLGYVKIIAVEWIFAPIVNIFK